MTTPKPQADAIDLEELTRLASAPSIHHWWRAATLARPLVDGIGAADAAFIAAAGPSVVLALLQELAELRAKVASHREPVQVGTLTWTREAMRVAGHTCVLTRTTFDGSVPPPCAACQESR